ncbi:MAG: hypothetical protein ACTHMY_24410 [Solirubrobacteraceae bacterium]
MCSPGHSLAGLGEADASGERGESLDRLDQSTQRIDVHDQRCRSDQREHRGVHC